MKTGATTVLLGVGAVAAMALLPRGAHAQPGGGGDGGDGGPPDGGPPGVAITDTSDVELVECNEDGSSAHYAEFLDGEGETMVRWAGSNTGCPNHVNWPLNPNPAAENPSNESIPAYPMLFDNGNTTDLSSSPRTIGIMRNGVAMFSSWARDQVVSYEDTAFYLEADTFDPCGGHATTGGEYHYHSTAGCLQEQAGGVVEQHSPLLGWAYDGFPFYGQLGPGGIEMKMCGADGADPEVCLDGCSGYEAFIDEDEFAYRYYTSCGFDESFFPFTANCFRGCCPEGVTCSDKVEACGNNPDIGYTTMHVPEPSIPLDDQYDAILIDGDDVDVIDSKFSVDCTLYLGAVSLATSSSTGSTTLPTTTSTTPAATAPIGGGETTTSTPTPAAAISFGVTPSPEASAATGDGETESPLMSTTGIAATPSPANQAEVTNCSVSALSDAAVGQLSIYDKDLYLEPNCVNAYTPLPAHCNCMGLGQECRSCFKTCDGAKNYMADLAEEIAVWGADAIINFCPNAEVDHLDAC